MGKACSVVLCFMVCGALMGTPPECADAAATFSSDYRLIWAGATYEDGDGDEALGCAYEWQVNGTPLVSGTVSDLFHVHFNDSLLGTGGESPLQIVGQGYQPGRWNSGLILSVPGGLSYARENNFNVSGGTVELWVALRTDGNDPVYADRSHYLFHYASPGGDYVVIAQDSSSGVLFAGGSTNGQWQSAWSQLGNTRSWDAMEWHHVAYTFSEAESFMRFYLDGQLIADTNEGFYVPPAGDGAEFYVGGDIWGRGAYHVVDEFRILNHPLTGEEIATRFARETEPMDFEQSLDTSQLTPGDSVVFEFTPSDQFETGVPCQSAPLAYPGIPLTDPSPPSTLIAPGETGVSLSLTSVDPTQCAFSVGQILPFAQMTPFDSGSGTTSHESLIPLDPDPNTVNEVYVRSAAYPDFLLHLRYRVRSEVNPGFPRTGNLWGYGSVAAMGSEALSKIDLYLGAWATPEQMYALRELNPEVLVLTSINAVENRGLPDDYYLKDIYGNRIEVWPGSYRLNLTKLYVAEYQAKVAYQTVLASDLLADGCFFDNVFTTQSWLSSDIYGNPVYIDADENGIEDDPEVLDAAWKAGVFHEMNTFASLMPDAIVNGHAMNIAEPGISDLFHGISIGFFTADVIEGKRPFSWLWERYEAWLSLARSPQITMIESSPPDVLAYGYDYSPWNKIPAETLEFCRTFFPYVRFGLAFTLMNDGYFAHEFGDTWHGNAWWYDELDVDLGMPLGPAQRMALGNPDPTNLIVNPGFENTIAYPWSLWANSGAGCDAQGYRDTTEFAEGEASVRIEINATSGVSWHVDFAQYDRTLTQDTNYKLTFWTKSDAPRPISLSASQGVSPWVNYGLSHTVNIDTQWQQISVIFQANTTASDARIQFFLGAVTGSVWIDEVSVIEVGPDVYARTFDHGFVVLNGSTEMQEIPLGYAYQKFEGNQAPKVQYLSHDEDASFTKTGAWIDVTLDSGEWQASGPFYHDWGVGCRKSVDPTDWAQWELSIPFADTYTVEVWWPDAPERDTWSQSVQYQILADGSPVSSASLDQTQDGDRWYLLDSVALDPQQVVTVRVESADGRPCIADALHVTSDARYNDGSIEPVLTLQPMDGIVLIDAPPGNCPQSDLATDAGTDVTICHGQETELVCATSGGLPPYRYEWSPAEFCDDPTAVNPSVFPTDTQIFSVIVTDDEGCKVQDVVSVVVISNDVSRFVWRWRDPAAYEADFDLDGNATIDLLDLVAAIQLCQTP